MVNFNQGGLPARHDAQPQPHVLSDGELLYHTLVRDVRLSEFCRFCQSIEGAAGREV